MITMRTDTNQNNTVTIYCFNDYNPKTKKI
uniref:Uncharacterized protein n=1 Tax=Anguilla anguilla TaxID=7936 RepID=A0A0E9XVU7_ANGAN